MLEKLSLGTAQIGMDYGVCNNSGRIPKSEVANIFQIGKKVGVRHIDTASSYGLAYNRLANFLTDDHLITSKILVDHKSLSYDYLFSEIKKIQSDLKSTQLETLLIHNASQCSADYLVKLWPFMLALKENGYCKRVGLSVYSPSDLDGLMQTVDIDVVQIPYNIVSRSIWNSEQLVALRDSGVIIQMRSLFLQGLLLADPKDVSGRARILQGAIKKLRQFCTANDLTALQVALGFALSRDPDLVVVGVDNSSHWKVIVDQILTFGQVGFGSIDFDEVLSFFSNIDFDLRSI